MNNDMIVGDIERALSADGKRCNVDVTGGRRTRLTSQRYVRRKLQDAGAREGEGAFGQRGCRGARRHNFHEARINRCAAAIGVCR